MKKEKITKKKYGKWGESYKVEFEKMDGSICRIQHYKDCITAETALQAHSRALEDKSNIMNTNNRYGHIWESKLIIA